MRRCRHLYSVGYDPCIHFVHVYIMGFVNFNMTYTIVMVPVHYSVAYGVELKLYLMLHDIVCFVSELSRVALSFKPMKRYVVPSNSESIQLLHSRKIQQGIKIWWFGGPPSQPPN